MNSRYWHSVLMLAALALALVIFVLVVSHSSDRKDQREVRHYGDLECVYNVTKDVVEACR